MAEDELIKTFIEEYGGACDEFSKTRYKNATILFSKALFALCDFIIVSKLKRLPQNHAERFKILKNYFPEIYPIVDEVFDKYTDSYSKPILKETGEGIKNAIATIKHRTELPQEIKDTLE